MKKKLIEAVQVFAMVISVALCSAGCSSLSQRTKTPVGQHPGSFQKEIVQTVGGEYLLYLPPEYNDTQEKWPLILFLHGTGERGNDLSKVEAHGPPMLIAKEGKSFPFIIVSPQCPEGVLWTADKQVVTLNALLDSLVSRYRIDKDRMYGTGLSIGADGLWRLATAHPDRFAAIALICGGGDPAPTSSLAPLPVWAFHGQKDNYIPIKRTEEMVEALKQLGGNVTFTAYPDTKHNAWTQTYENPELYNWFLSHSRSTEKTGAGLEE